MNRYRKIPVIIEAVELTWRNAREVAEWCNGFISQPGTIISPCVVIIKTLEGDMRANEFDFVIKGTKGEFYPCKPHIFNEVYELVP